jgi:hypothetical protein
MLERVALHQTRLRVPGVGLDARGVVLGARGLVLLPSLDRLVAWLAVYTESQPLDALTALRIEVLKSKLGTRELALSFDAGSSDRMDRIAEVARLTGGFTFTGTSRHFVQYRDGAAPFGYDAFEITPSDAAVAVYHTSFSQTYEVERALALRDLLFRLRPHPDPKSSIGDDPIWLVAEPGLGPSLSSYLLRSGVDARATLAEWPAESSFDQGPRRRWLLHVPRLPKRMRPSLGSTPGIDVFLPAGTGVAVEHRFRHPITLHGCPVFDADSLVLIFGRRAPLAIAPLPVLADVRSLARAEVSSSALDPQVGKQHGQPPSIRVPLRLVPSLAPPSSIAATLIPADELDLLRRLAYGLGSGVIRSMRIALTEVGAFLLRERGVELLPLGSFFRRLHPRIYVPSGFEVAPLVDPNVLFGALGSPADKIVFLMADSRVLALDESAFVPLDGALLAPEPVTVLPAIEIEAVLETETPTLWLEPLGLAPLRGAEPVR